MGHLPTNMSKESDQGADDLDPEVMLIKTEIV